MTSEKSSYPGGWLRIAQKDLRRVERALRDRDAEAAGFFLQQAVEKFLRSVVCNGRTVFEHVCRLVQGRVLATGRLARVPWYVGSGAIGARELALAGWNIPLARPTGLGAEGERELGQTLGAQLRGLGLG